MFYYVCKAKYLWQNEEVSTETFQVCAETKEAALEKANCHCDKTVKQIVYSFKSAAEKLGKEIDVNIIYVFTGEWQEAKFKIIGDNGITEGPMSEFEANERIIGLIEEFPDTKFEIEEVK